MIEPASDGRWRIRGNWFQLIAQQGRHTHGAATSLNRKEDGKLEISLAQVEMPEPKPDEVLVRVEASPINPSDLGLLFGGADMTTAKVSGTGAGSSVTATAPWSSCSFGTASGVGAASNFPAINPFQPHHAAM
jgi:hypothetical protein